MGRPLGTTGHLGTTIHLWGTPGAHLATSKVPQGPTLPHLGYPRGTPSNIWAHLGTSDHLRALFPRGEGGPTSGHQGTSGHMTTSGVPQRSRWPHLGTSGHLWALIPRGEGGPTSGLLGTSGHLITSGVPQRSRWPHLGTSGHLTTFWQIGNFVNF